MRPRLLLIAAALTVLAAAAVLWLRPHDAPEADRPPISGAAQALVWWEMARTYPEQRFPSEGFAAAFAQHQALRATSDEGDPVWEPMGPTNNGGRTLAIVLNPERPETVWAGSAGGGLWRSYTGGTGGAWARVATGFPVTSATAVAIAPSDTGVVYLGTGEGYRYMDVQGGVVNRPTRGSYGIGVLKSEDGGATWSHVLDWSLHQERGVQKVRVNPADPDDVWAATTEGVLRSTDGRQTWTPLTNGVPDDFIGKIILSGYPADPDVVYASVGDGIETSGPTSTTLIRTLDGGATWTDVTGALPDVPTNAVIVDPQFPDEVYVGNDLGVYRSEDGGQTWTTFSAGLPEAVMVMDLQVSIPDHSLRVATHGNGMWKRSLGRAPVAAEPGAPASGLALEPVAPNPVRGPATVAFRLAEAGAVHVAVYDLRGREVALLASGERAAGRHEVALAASRLAAGTYVVRLEADGQTQSQRVTVVR